MNAKVSESILLELRKQVERAVRPVRACRKRKLIMREELLAHLTELYGEEQLRVADEKAALAAAFGRFGEPVELAAELNRSVGVEERIGYRLERAEAWLERWVGLREGEPVHRLALRMTGVVGVIVALMVAFVGVLQVFLPLDDDPTKYPLLFKMLVGAAFSLWAFLMGFQTTLRALYGPQGRIRWAAGIGASAVWTLVLVLLSDGLWWTITGSSDAVQEKLPRSLFWGFATLPFIFMMIAWIAKNEKALGQQHREWQSLELER